MRRHKHGYCGYGPRHGFGGAMSLEEEVEMLEKAKEHLEKNLANVNERLEKLKA
jgi:prefoldin subunit 5